MQVRAITTGFYDGQRRRHGTVFEMDDAHIKKDDKGKIVKPKWVMDASAPAPVAAKKKGARGDTKPADAQAAAKAKTSGEGGNDSVGGGNSAEGLA